MGWASGTDIAEAVIKAVLEHVPEAETRKKIYRPIVEAMEEADWDTHNEVYTLDEVFDDLLREMHPDWDWDEEGEDMKEDE